MVRSSENEAINLEVWYSLDGRTWLGTKSILEPVLVEFQIGDSQKTLLFGSSQNYRLIVSKIKIKSPAKIIHSCLQMEVFGCKIDVEFDLKCDSPLRVEEFMKSDPTNDRVAVEEYFRKSYFKISNHHKSLWISQFMKRQESCGLVNVEKYVICTSSSCTVAH